MAAPASPAGLRISASAMMTTSWIVKSTAPAMKREPMPASVSSTSTPSGVAIAIRSSNATGRRA